MRRLGIEFNSTSSVYLLLDGYLRRPGGGKAYDAFAADLSRVLLDLTPDELLHLTITACDHGKAGHAYRLLKAGADKDRVKVYMNEILPDAQYNFQRLRRDAFNSASGHMTFDEIMDRHTPGKNPAAKMARDMDLLQKYPERYLTLDQVIKATRNIQKP